MGGHRLPSARHSRIGAACALVAVALALAACGSSPSAANEAKAALSSLEHHHAAEFDLALASTALPSGAYGMIADPRTLVAKLRFDLIVSSLSSGSLAAAGKNFGSDLTVDDDGEALLRIETIASAATYLEANITNWTTLPLKVTPGEQQSFRALAASTEGRWFVVPSSAPIGITTTSALLHALSVLKAALLKDSNFATQSSSQHGAPGSPSTTEITGTGALGTVLGTLAPAIGGVARLIGHPIPESDLSLAGAVNGNYTLSLFTSAASLLNYLALEVSFGGDTAHLAMSISHPDVTVQAPAGATTLPKGLLGLLGRSR